VNLVGISAHFHVAAAQEERFSRRKHEPAIPTAAFRFCLDEAGLTMADLDAVAYYEDTPW
jgi:carbamoyltransferase